MRKRRPHLAIFLLIFLMTHAAVLADCPPLIQTGCAHGIRTGIVWFGLRHDGANIGVGQSVTFECPTRLLGVEFQFAVHGTGNNGVPPLLPGDEVQMSVLKLSGVVLMTVTATLTGPINGGVNAPWIFFDFSEVEHRLDPGQYLLATHTDLPQQDGVSYCNYDDDYAGGERRISHNGLAGPWFPEAAHDLPFRIYREPYPVASSLITWSTVKATYR